MRRSSPAPLRAAASSTARHSGARSTPEKPRGRSWALSRTSVSSISISHPGSEMFIVDFISAPPGFGGTYFAVRTQGAPLAIRANVRSDRPRARFLCDRGQRGDDGTDRVERGLGSPTVRGAAGDLRGRRRGLQPSASMVCSRSSSHTGPRDRIRMALGARPTAVVSLVVRQSAVQIVVGVIAGIGGAALLSRYLEGLLFGVAPLDSLTFAGRRNHVHPGGARSRVSACAAGHAGRSGGRCTQSDRKSACAKVTDFLHFELPLSNE